MLKNQRYLIRATAIVVITAIAATAAAYVDVDALEAVAVVIGTAFAGLIDPPVDH